MKCLGIACRYEVRVPKDELDAVSDLRYSWKKLHKLATEVSDGLAKMQVATAGQHAHPQAQSGGQTYQR